jgi:hypothetical protein
MVLPVLTCPPHLGHLAVLLALTCNCAAAQSSEGFSVEIVEADPESEATLDAREPLYLRIAYGSDIALRFQAAGFVDGVEVRDTEAMSIAPPYPPGRGEAVAWVSYEAATRIDEVRVTVFDASWKKLDTVTLMAGSNLWPLMLLFLMPFAFAYLVAVWLAKSIWGRPA